MDHSVHGTVALRGRGRRYRNGPVLIASCQSLCPRDRSGEATPGILRMFGVIISIAPWLGRKIEANGHLPGLVNIQQAIENGH